MLHILLPDVELVGAGGNGVGCHPCSWLQVLAPWGDTKIRESVQQAFDPEQDLFDQISGIKARVALGLGSSTFAGISIVTGQLLSQLPTSRAALSKPGYLKQLTQLVHSLYRLVQAAAMTVADAMVFRSEPLSVLMQQLNIDVSSKAAAASAANDLVIPDFVLDLQDVSSDLVRGGSLAETMAAEGVRLRYAIDTHLDDLLARVYRGATEAPLLPNPFGKVMSIIRSEGCKMELWQTTTATLQAVTMNTLTRVGPAGCFIYAGRASGARLRHLADGAKRMPAHLQERDSVELQRQEAAIATVYGVYSAVQYADAVMLQRLHRALPLLLSGTSNQQAQYSVDVLCSLLADAAVTNCTNLMDHYTQALVLDHEVAASRIPELWQAYHHQRYSHVHVQHLYCLEGPSQRGAMHVCAAAIVDYLLSVHSTQGHLVHALQVGKRLLRIDDIVTHRDQVVEVIFEHVRGLDTSAQGASGDWPVCRASLFVATGPYTPVQIYFRFLLAGKDQPQHAPLQDVASRHRLHKPPARRGIWDDDVYRRVFLTEREALRWWQINRTLGSPGQPYHSQPFAERACKQATALIAGEANFLGAMKLLLMAACVTQEHDAATELGRALTSHCQEIACVRIRLRSLKSLVTESSPEFAATRDRAALAKSVNSVLACVQRIVSSPKYCYFSGLAKQVMETTQGARYRLSSLAEVTDEDVGYLAELDVFLHCCEISVGQNVYMTIPEDLAKQVGLPRITYAGKLAGDHDE